jgi:probable F420-dependent oxidoreductase
MAGAVPPDRPEAQPRRPPRFAVASPYWRGRPPAEAIEVAVGADAAGFPEIWLGETNAYDAFAVAAAVAARTRGAKLVVGPLPVSVRSPALLAMGIAAVAEIGGRPAGLALGTSSPAIVEGWHGARRVSGPAAIEEVTACLRGLFAGGRSHLEGTAARSVGFRLRGPVPGTTIDVAAGGPRMAALAARVGDGLVANMVSPAQLAALREAAGLHAAEGADPPPARLAVWVQTALDPRPEDRAAFKRDLAIYLGAPGYGERFSELGSGELVAAVRDGLGLEEAAARIPDELPEAIGAFGDIATVGARVGEYVAAGADTVVLQPVTYGDPGGRRVLSALSGALL